MSSGKKSLPSCPNPKPRLRVDPNQSPIALASRASCGSFAAAPAGKTCQRPILLPAPVGVVCASGRNKRCGLRHGAPFWRNLTAKDSLMGPKPLLTAALPRPKKGALRRPHQEGQRYEVDGGGRRPRCSSGKPPGIGVRSASDLAKSPRASLMTRRRTQTPFASVCGLGALI